MTTSSLRNYLETLFPSDVIINGASTKAPSISVFPAPESRWGKIPFIGGPECNDFKKLPVNILVRWSDDTASAFSKARDVYKELDGKNNFTVDGVDIAYISMLDDDPVWLGRAEGNIVEFIIRADIFYFVGGNQ